MNRKEFLKTAALLGLGSVAWPLLSCSPKRTNDPPSNVLIIGAGAAGLSAAYLLQQRNINYEILEASDTYGGRMKKTDAFADFPIPLGAEWLSTDASIFERAVNDPGVSVNIPTVGYRQDDEYGLWQNGQLVLTDLEDFQDRKFVGSSWFDFFEQYIYPSVSGNIRYQTQVRSIDYSGSQVQVKTDQTTYTADAVILTVPVKLLQLGELSFTPALPNAKTNAIQNLEVWDGLKVFIEFSQKFYPTFVDVPMNPVTSGQLVYYDAAYGQATQQHILGVFMVGAPAQQYGAYDSDTVKQNLLQELDTIFNGQATPAYRQHIVQHWGAEPFIRGAYVNDHANWRQVAQLADPVDEKLYFAGDAYTDGSDWGNVHNAIVSARTAVDQMLS